MYPVIPEAVRTRSHPELEDSTVTLSPLFT